MRPRIKQHSNITTGAVTLQCALTLIKTAEQKALVSALLQRYGVIKLSGLLPKQVLPFTTELKAVLSGRAPDPRDSVLDPSMMEIR